jgi:hypothetical protein
MPQNPVPMVLQWMLGLVLLLVLVIILVKSTSDLFKLLVS